MSERILVVDDSPEDIRLILEFLRDDYTVLAANNGEKGIEKALAEPTPDVVLMDASMDGIDGYQACETILKQKQLDIIFVSANDTTEEIMKGYQAGGIDYITKPFSPEVMSSKIKLAIDNRKKHQALANQSEVAQQQAQDASDMSLVVDYLRSSLKPSSLAQIAEHLTSAISQFELQVVVKVAADEGKCYATTRGDASALEKELLDRMHNNPEQFIEHGQRLFINYGETCVLIKNMPTGNTEKCTRIRDAALIMMEGASAQLSQLSSSHSAGQSSRSWINPNEQAAMINEARMALHDLQDQQSQHQKQSFAILHDMLNDVESEFTSLGLTDRQEEHLMSTLNSSVDSITDHFEKNDLVMRRLVSVIEQLQLLE